MGKTIVKKVPDEDVYYRWDDQVYLDEVADDIVIIGDRHYIMFGNDDAVRIIKGDFYDGVLEDPYDYETIDELNKVMGGDWEETEFRGYSQGDWCQVYYNKEKVSQGLLKELEIFIMGKVDEFLVQDDEDNEDDVYSVFVPHDVVWDGKKAICEYLGLTDPSDVIVLEDDGYKKVYNYKEITD